MRILYTSACFDSSGYAEAARNYIGALTSVGVEVSPIPLSFETHRTNLGEIGDAIKRMMAVPRNGKIQIIHATPENFPRLIKVGVYNIGYVAWETSRLPDTWVPLINRLNEVWVPCTHNAQVFQASGVRVPITVVPHAFREEMRGSVGDVLSSVPAGDYIFYSIFQWTARKNPEGLLRAYLTEFSEADKVSLVIKSYIVNPENPTEGSRLRALIADIKRSLYLPSYPRVTLISSLLSREQVLGLHVACDCYVSLARCEGFGIPLVEAMSAGRPVITTAYGGPTDFVCSGAYGQLREDKGGSLLWLANHTMTPCAGMPWPIYTGHMNWAEPDIDHAKRLMRLAFQDKEKAAQMGLRAQEWVRSTLSWEAVGSLMKARLEAIEREQRLGV